MHKGRHEANVDGAVFVVVDGGVFWRHPRGVKAMFRTRKPEAAVSAEQISLGPEVKALSEDVLQPLTPTLIPSLGNGSTGEPCTDVVIVSRRARLAVSGGLDQRGGEVKEALVQAYRVVARLLAEFETFIDI